MPAKTKVKVINIPLMLKHRFLKNTLKDFKPEAHGPQWLT